MITVITGGIGAGKSRVCDLLRQRGITVYDCDTAAKKLMRESLLLRQKLIELIGPEAYRADGLPNKRAISAFLLQSEENKQAVNDIVHPAVAEDFRTSGCQWMECAIFFESRFDQRVAYDRVICVCAPEEVRTQRVAQRDHITTEQARQWIHRQMSQDEVAKKSDHVINNDGTQDLEQQLTKYL